MQYVILNGPQHKQTRTWCCNNDWEAKRMTEWLADNGIKSSVISIDDWSILPNYINKE
jgi:hypothetical protein